MDRNPRDWSVKVLFGEIGAFDCSRGRFAALLEEAVHPLAQSGDESCLVYDRPIGLNGLLWSELVAWWSEITPGANVASLGARLQVSLASDAERKHFAIYFKAYRPLLGEALPALLPQVYLHYDPAIVKTLRHRLPLRMRPARPALRD